MAQTLSPGPSGRAGAARAPVTGTAAPPTARSGASPSCVELYRSAVGKKYVMAITGIVLMGFVLAHMIGNLKMYLGPERAQPLRRVPARAAACRSSRARSRCGCCASA